MRTTVIVCSVVCVATVLSELLGIGFLWYRGQLTTDAVDDIRLILAGQNQDSMAVDDEAQRDRPSSEDYIRERTMRILELNTRQEELDLLKRMVSDKRKQLIDEKSKFDEKRKEFQTALLQLQSEGTATASEQTRGILLSLQPADAMAHLMALPAADNVMLLKGMPEKSIAKILKEFLSGDKDQRERGEEVFQAISQGEPSKGLIDDTLKKFAGDAAAGN